jgi:hypothetical protein
MSSCAGCKKIREQTKAATIAFGKVIAQPFKRAKKKRQLTR